MHDIEALRLNCIDYIKDNLPELANELLEWDKNTVIKKDGKVKTLEKMLKEFISDSQSLRLAENMIHTQALRYVAKYHR